MTDFNTDMVKAIQTHSLSSVICDQLEEMILSGKILPGERINESRLADALGVSRAPIREACRQLERSGMVEVRVNRGTFVKKINIKEVEELYEIRATLDALAGEKAAQLISDQQIPELKDHLDEMEAAVEKEDHQKYFKANLGFHMCIMRIAGNQNLISIYDGVCKKASLFRRTSLSLPGRLPESFRQHQSIYQAILARNPQKTSELMKHHLMDAKTVLLAACEKPED